MNGLRALGIVLGTAGLLSLGAGCAKQAEGERCDLASSGNADCEPGNYPEGPVAQGGKVHAMLDKYPNLYADLSAGSALNALKRDKPHAEKFLCRYADRLLFARDYHGSDLYDFLQSLTLPQEVQDKIYFQNAKKLVPVEQLQ